MKIFEMKNNTIVVVGEGQGKQKGLDAVRQAVADFTPEASLVNANYVVVRLSGDIALNDANDVTDYVKELAGENVEVVFSAIYDDSVPDHCVVIILVLF